MFCSHVKPERLKTDGLAVYRRNLRDWHLSSHAWGKSTAPKAHFICSARGSTNCCKPHKASNNSEKTKNKNEKKHFSPWKRRFSLLGFSLPSETPFLSVIFHSLLEGN